MAERAAPVHQQDQVDRRRGEQSGQPCRKIPRQKLGCYQQAIGSKYCLWDIFQVPVWDFSADLRISAGGGGGGGGEEKEKEKEKTKIECIKTAVFDTRNPKSTYGGPSPLPHPPPTQSLCSLDARSIHSLAKLSSSFFKYFLSHSCLYSQSALSKKLQKLLMVHLTRYRAYSELSIPIHSISMVGYVTFCVRLTVSLWAEQFCDCW